MTRPPPAPAPHRRLALAAILVASCVPAAAAAAEIDRIVGVSLGYSEFRFRPKIDSSLSFPTASLTAGASWGRFYGTVGYGGSPDDADVSEEDFTGLAERRDLDLTVGWQVNGWLGLFAGWKDGSTRLDLEPREDDGDAAPARVRERYGQEGPYLGASVTHRTDRYGIFAASIAWARLDADNRFVADGDGADDGEPPEFDDLSGSVNGDSRGFSYALGWTQPLGAELLYRAQIRVNDYEQELEFAGRTFDDLDQRFVSFTMGLNYVF